MPGSLQVQRVTGVTMGSGQAGARGNTQELKEARKLEEG